MATSTVKPRISFRFFMSLASGSGGVTRWRASDSKYTLGDESPEDCPDILIEMHPVGGEVFWMINDRGERIIPCEAEVGRQGDGNSRNLRVAPRIRSTASTVVGAMCPA
jgi:hypothetical protein